MKASDIYASPFVNGSDIVKPTKLTIHEVSVQEFTDQRDPTVKQKKVVLSFSGARKRLILNRTNAHVLMAAFGDELNGWPGNQVILNRGQAPNGQPMVVVTAMPVEEEGEGREPDSSF